MIKFKELFEKVEYQWVGGPDDYKSIEKIAKIIQSYDFYSNRKEGSDHRRAVQDNQMKAKKLKALGVIAWRGENDDEVIDSEAFKKADKKDIKKSHV